MDVGGRYSGTVSGAMNMIGNIAGGISPLVVGYLLTWTSNDWTMTFYVSAAIYSLGAVCWYFLDSQTPLEAPRQAAVDRAVNMYASPTHVK
jgi:MFS transporter, ACS family, glucarate transporter